VNWRGCKIAPSGCLVSRYLLITGRATLPVPPAFVAGTASPRFRSVLLTRWVRRPSSSVSRSLGVLTLDPRP
jgi:hypothetical protein